MTRPAPYLFRYPRSKNWYLRLQIPKELRAPGEPAEIRKSLGTHDRRLAEIAAAEEVQAHRKRLWAAQNQRNGWGVMRDLDSWMYPLGRTVLEDGTIQIATEELCYRINPATGETEEFYNAQEAEWDEEFDPENPPGPIMVLWSLKDGPPDRVIEPPRAKPKAEPAPSDDDLAILAQWVETNGINQHLEREARDTFTIFQSLTGGKALKDCRKVDGLKLVSHFQAEGLKRATIQKKVGHLRAMVNVAIMHEVLASNPFTNILPKKKIDDERRREDFSEEHMALVREHLFTDLFKPEERLLWVLLACTGMRRSEAWQILKEENIQGLRCVTIGQKTKASLRTIPLPDQVLPFLPKKIEGCLFADSDPARGPVNVGKRLLRRIRRLGIEADEDVVVHSLRHRAISRLRYMDCSLQRMFWIFGHNEVTVHSRYGKVPVPKLKPWIDRIGY